MKTGIAIAGGGVSGFASIGVIQALEEAGIEITHIAGSSSGSVVAALYAYGYSPQELCKMLPHVNRRHLDIDVRSPLLSLFSRYRHVDGLIKGDRLRQIIEKLTDGATLSRLHIPCGIVTTDLKSGETIVCSQIPLPDFPTISEIPVATAVQASFSIPVIFRPVRYSSYVLVDGGVNCNCPVQIVKQLGATHVISVDTVTPFVKNRNLNLQSGKSILYHVIHLHLYHQMKQEHSYADITLHPDVGQVSTLAFHKAMQCVEAGYTYTKARISAIKEKLTTPV